MRRFLIALAVVLMPAAASAQTTQSLTVRDIIELTKADLGEDALLALIEVNRPIFPVDVVTLKSLKDAGVASSVITAMIRSGRTQPPSNPAPQPPEDPANAVTAVVDAPIVVIEHHEEARVREVPVAVPVYVAVPVRRGHRDPDHPSRPPAVAPIRPADPVFWGWGGKLRPDAWKPSIELPKDAKIERQKR